MRCTGVRARQRGWSKFEFALTSALFALLVSIGLERLGSFQQRVESAAAEQLVDTLRAALTIKVSQLSAAQRQSDVGALLDDNPMLWLSAPPSNYLGEYYAPDPRRLAPGNWYFDRGRKLLAYKHNAQNNFSSHTFILLEYKVKSSQLPMAPQRTGRSAVIANVALVQIIEPDEINHP